MHDGSCLYRHVEIRQSTDKIIDFRHSSSTSRPFVPTDTSNSIFSKKILKWQAINRSFNAKKREKLPHFKDMNRPHWKVLTHWRLCWPKTAAWKPPPKCLCQLKPARKSVRWQRSFTPVFKNILGTFSPFLHVFEFVKNRRRWRKFDCCFKSVLWAIYASWYVF